MVTRGEKREDFQMSLTESSVSQPAVLAGKMGTVPIAAVPSVGMVTAIDFDTAANPNATKVALDRMPQGIAGRSQSGDLKNLLPNLNDQGTYRG